MQARIFGGLLLLWLAAGLGAAEAETPLQEPAQPGRFFRLQLGRGVELAFVWIAPMQLWVGETEISNAQFRRYDASHSSSNLLGRDLDHDLQPVVQVSWEEAHNYCGWLNRRYGAWLPAKTVFRLPTEKEWETYASCGQQRRYPWGNQYPPPATHNYRGMEGSLWLYRLFQKERFIRGHNDGYIVACPVHQSGRNSWGLYGVGGNVWEWCADWFDITTGRRAIRGAAWNNEEEAFLRIKYRAGVAAEARNACLGFRVVLAGP